jgi:hypothetical protein
VASKRKKRLAAEVYFDSSLRHSVYVRRYVVGEMRRVADFWALSDRELTRYLRDTLGRVAGKAISMRDPRLLRILKEAHEFRSIAHTDFRSMQTGAIVDFAKLEIGVEKRIIEAAIPFRIELANPAAGAARFAVEQKAINGRTLSQWFDNLKAADRSAYVSHIQRGIAMGSDQDTIVRGLVGTRANRYTDGVLAVPRRQAQTVVRTMLNHASNAAKEEVWAENPKVVSGVVWVSTLDGRTSPTCQDNDGAVELTDKNQVPPGGRHSISPPGLRPPAHPGCRSAIAGWIDGVPLLGNRPFVRDKRARGARETDFRAEARRSGLPIAEVRKRWAAENIGQIPAKTTYAEWIRKQPAAFQDDVLGKTKGALLRRGGMNVRAFVDSSGKSLTLKQLAATRPEAFTRAGFDPDTF